MTMPKIAGWSLQLSLLQLVTRVISGCTYNPNSGHSKSNMWSGFFFCGPTWRCFVLCFSTFSVSFLFNHHLYWDVFCCVSIRTRRNRDLHFSYSRSHLLPPDGWMDGWSDGRPHCRHRCRLYQQWWFKYIRTDTSKASQHALVPSVKINFMQH